MSLTSSKKQCPVCKEWFAPKGYPTHFRSHGKKNHIVITNQVVKVDNAINSQKGVEGRCWEFESGVAVMVNDTLRWYPH